MAKDRFSGVQNGSQSNSMGVLGGYLCWKVVLEFWFGHPKCHFRYPPKSPKWVILGVFGYFEIEIPIEAEILYSKWKEVSYGKTKTV